MSDFVPKFIATTLALAITASAVSGQSGRRRTSEAPPPSRTPATKPVPESSSPAIPKKPSTPGSTLLERSIPKGGEVIFRQSDPGTATNRFTLANGLAVAVRERHSQPFASVALVAQPGWPDQWLRRAVLARLSLRVLVNEVLQGSRESLLTGWRRSGAVIELEVEDDRPVLQPGGEVLPGELFGSAKVREPFADCPAEQATEHEFRNARGGRLLEQ